MSLLKVVQMMNENMEKRKHSGETMIFDMQKEIVENYHVDPVDLYTSMQYLPIGEKPNSLEAIDALKEALVNYEKPELETHKTL